MSFHTSFSPDLESGDDVPSHYKDFPEFDNLSQTIDNALYDINNHQLVSIKNLLHQLEACLTSPELELQAKASKISKKISDLTTKCTEAFKDINDRAQDLNRYLRECQRNREDEDTVRYLKQKEAISLKLIRASLHQFQRHQKQFTLLQTESPREASAARLTADQQQLSQSQQQHIQITYEPLNAEELEQQSLLIEEREREIQQISQGTQEINEIFLNLQDIVQEQQFQIDTIEDNILSYSADAQGASRELRKAERYQRRAGGRMLCCLLILLGVVGSVVLIGVVF